MVTASWFYLERNGKLEKRMQCGRVSHPCNCTKQRFVISTRVLKGNNLFSIDRHSPMYSATVEYSIDINRRLQNEAMFRQVKAKLAAGEKVDRVAKDFNSPSQVCPGE
jgi:hypothetical protein